MKAAGLIGAGSVVAVPGIASALPEPAPANPVLPPPPVPLPEQIPGPEQQLHMLASWILAHPQEPDYGENRVDLTQLGQGSVSLTPNDVPVDQVTDFTFTYTAGGDGISAGGGIRFEVRCGTDTAQYSTNWTSPQTGNPNAVGYVRAVAPIGVTVGVVTDAYLGTVLVQVLFGKLGAGKTVRIEFRANPSAIAGDIPIRFQEKTRTGSPWRNLIRPVLTRRPGPVSHFLAVSPSDVVVGEQFDVRIAALDRYGNCAKATEASLIADSAAAEVLGVAALRFAHENEGILKHAGASFNAAGFRKLVFTHAGGLPVYGNATKVWDSPPLYRRYWGDTHFHTGEGLGERGFRELGTYEGGDHRGEYTSQADSYTYLRDVAFHDFAAASEHSMIAFKEAQWKKTHDVADAFNDPGNFTTFYGYEYTNELVDGHKVVLFKERGGVYAMDLTGEFPTAQVLLAALEVDGKEAIVIPHMMSSAIRPHWGARWNPKFQRLAEIYSHHNDNGVPPGNFAARQFEVGSSSHLPLSDPRRSSSLQYGWAAGQRVGVVGVSDSHSSNVGVKKYTHYTGHDGGLTGVLARENSREGIWNAKFERRCAATTGHRVLLDLTVDGAPMGSEIAVGSGHNPRIVWEAACGEANVAAVELVRYQGGEQFDVIAKWNPNTFSAEGEHIDSSFSGHAMYYLRVMLAPISQNFEGGHAWTSPIWVDENGVIPQPAIRAEEPPIPEITPQEMAARVLFSTS